MSIEDAIASVLEQIDVIEAQTRRKYLSRYSNWRMTDAILSLARRKILANLHEMREQLLAQQQENARLEKLNHDICLANLDLCDQLHENQP